MDRLPLKTCAVAFRLTVEFQDQSCHPVVSASAYTTNDVLDGDGVGLAVAFGDALGVAVGVGEGVGVGVTDGVGMGVGVGVGVGAGVVPGALPNSISSTKRAGCAAPLQS